MSATLDSSPAAVDSVLDVSIIIPTYREAENLPVIVPRVAAALADAGLRGEIIVVDDNSPDRTREVCAELAALHPLRLEVRARERGLSSAVLHGMRRARGDILVVMDADLSHPPERVPDLVRALRDDADFVVGSRYVAGGRTDDDWGWFRWLNSKTATLLAWPLTSIRDPMAGFFALRKTTLLAAAPLDPIGYKIGLELLVKCGCRRVREAPIHFRDRLHGESKLTLKEQVNYLRHLTRLYDFKLGGWLRPALFGLVGLSGMAIDLAALWLLLWATPLAWARAAAILLAMTWNFALNRAVTFADAAPRPWWKQYPLYCLSNLLGGAVNWGVTLGLCGAMSFFREHPLLAASPGVLLGAAFNYTLCRQWVFRTKD